MKPADIRWEGDQPFNRTYDDVYHNANGVDEIERVHIAPSKLTERFAAPRQHPQFTIGELGFGTALNFAVLAQRWLEINPHQAKGQLHFISAEQHPLGTADFARLAQLRSARLPIYTELLRRYPPLQPGWHRRYLANGRIVLSLFYGTADEAFADIEDRQRQPVDAWLLDGFAPNRNPDMWQPELLQKLRRLSGKGTTVSTFTAVGAVRRSLESAGFQMQRVNQMPIKLHSLAGELTQSMANDLQGRPAPSQVTVLGAGIAGATVAQHLALHQVPCQVLEAGTGAGGASRLPTTLLHGRLLADQGPSGRLRQQAASYAHAHCLGLPGYEPSGVLQVASDQTELERLQQVFAANAAPDTDLSLLDATAASSLGNASFTGGLQANHAGIVQLKHLLPALLNHASIALRPFNPANLEQLTPSEPTVLACGLSSRLVPAARFLELTAVAGQLDLVAMHKPPKLPLAGSSYQVPQVGSTSQANADPKQSAEEAQPVWIGASYEQLPWPPKQASQHNLKQLGAAAASIQWLGRARGIRCVSSDRLPVAGQLAERLWVSTGHGSMGMVSAQQSASIIASHLVGMFAPMQRQEEALLDPQRFLARQARRGYRFGAQPVLAP